MVPANKLTDLDRFWHAQRARLAESYFKATGYRIDDKTEFKSGFLNNLDHRTRKEFGLRIAYFLRKNACFIAGFYATVGSLLIYHLRTEIGKNHDAKELPPDWQQRLFAIRESLLRRKENEPGAAFLLAELGLPRKNGR